MRNFKRVALSLIASMIVFATVGCGGNDGENKGEENETTLEEANENLLLLGKESSDDGKIFYFLDGKGQIKTYKGYSAMNNFVDGVAHVEKKSEGHMLIDVNENVIQKAENFIYKSDGDFEYYICENEGKEGIYSKSGKELIKCQYEDIKTNHSGDYSQDAFMAIKEDGTVDIYLEAEKYICSVPNGYDDGYTFGYKYAGLSDNKAGVIRISIDNVEKYYSISDSKELSAEEFKNYYKGVAINDDGVVLYNEKLEKVADIKYDTIDKTYKSGYYNQGLYFLEPVDNKLNTHDVYNKQGKFIFRGNTSGDSKNIISNGNKTYFKVYVDDEYRLMDEEGKEVFTTSIGTKIITTSSGKYFYTEHKTEGIKVYNSDTLKLINNEIYKYTDDYGWAFKKENGDALIINAYGETYELAAEEGENICSNRGKYLANGYMAIPSSSSEGDYYYIIDFYGKKDKVKVKKGTEFNSLVPCYIYNEKVLSSKDNYFDFTGKPIEYGKTDK